MTSINQKQSILILISLFTFALIWNLGMTPILADEPTRTIVAQELDFNDNLFVPTINGQFYYNKPPVYNWIILGFYKITGSKSEIVSRIPVVISILLFITTLFFWCKRYMEKEMALLVGLIFATGSRLFFYDSMLGLIDVFFGWLILTTFILVYELEKSKKYTLLFTTTYTIIAVCFLMKGLQAIAFQGMTLLGWFIYRKQFKQLFRLPHFIGLGIFISIIGLFLWKYNQYNPLETLIETLWTESSKRTIGKQEWYHDLTHIILFPLKNILADTFPWGILLFFLISSKIRREVFKHDINKFALIIFSVNIIIYWLSPETRGRYLFPQYALLSIICVSIAYNFKVSHIIGTRPKNISRLIILITTGLTLLTFIIFLLVPKSNEFHSFCQESIPYLIVLFSLCIVSFIIEKKLTPYFSIILVLVLVRLIFDAVVLPFRKHHEPYWHYKTEAIRIAKTYQDKPLLIYRTTPIDHSTSHYFMLEQEHVIPRVRKKEKGLDAYYLFQKYHLKKETFEIIDSFPQNWKHKTIYVGK